MSFVPNLLIPPTGNTSSPDFTWGSALILVRTPRYELGALCPKFSRLQEVPEYRCENWYLHTIILTYKLKKLRMLFLTSCMVDAWRCKQTVYQKGKMLQGPPAGH
jgi:hypothetical protein